jgi:hypothetical protein
MALLDEIRDGAYVPDGPPLAVPGRLPTAVGAAERIRVGEQLLPVVRDLLDSAGRAAPSVLETLVAEPPETTGDPRSDALIAGVVEYLASTNGLQVPAWTQAPERFLDRFWFVSGVDGFRATAIAETPISLKRRGIFWPERSLRRV